MPFTLLFFRKTGQKIGYRVQKVETQGVNIDVPYFFVLFFGKFEAHFMPRTKLKQIKKK